MPVLWVKAGGCRSGCGGAGTRPAPACRACASARAFCRIRSCGFGWAAAGSRTGGSACRHPLMSVGLCRMPTRRFSFPLIAVCLMRSFGDGSAGVRSGPGRGVTGRSWVISGRRSRIGAGRLSPAGRVRISSAGLSRRCSWAGGGRASVPAGDASPGGCSLRLFFFRCFRLWREMDFETASAVCSRRLSAVV